MRSAPRRIGRIPGVAIFGGVMVLVLFAVGIAGNIMFDRSLAPSVSTAARQDGPQSVPAPTAASAPVVAAAPEAVQADAPPTPAAASVPAPQGTARSFEPPPADSVPDNEYGKMIRRGEQIFRETGRYAAKYVGNDLSCANCHLDAGRKADSAPLWASFIHYPAYRAKTGQVDTLASRLQGCFEYSMNGKAPPADDEVITALQTYSFWMAKGAPVGMPVVGSGYPKLQRPAQAPDYARGELVYQQNCAVCHGDDGQGQRAGNRQVFPPLWGPRSYNWGAGMHQLNNAAGFIWANMPLGKPKSLTEQEAWDVAMFMNSHERPQDPRYTGSIAETRRRFHDSPDSLYGLEVNGRVLGSSGGSPSRNRK